MHGGSFKYDGVFHRFKAMENKEDSQVEDRKEQEVHCQFDCFFGFLCLGAHNAFRIMRSIRCLIVGIISDFAGPASLLNLIAQGDMY
ncbi:hypothetical protein F0562_024980 [Nyssa sinensis]|uniref:Uncharacterized protein n=1 Tax=Nyssa sinensis TaxID=561372 RepID=A0A5J5BGA9_9ASTE|nr:hypothetical protein F0562_024980 [Nyssa sinensis]